jgi:hypothetical protein
VGVAQPKAASVGRLAGDDGTNSFSTIHGFCFPGC